jgi:hypothetical protein
MTRAPRTALMVMQARSHYAKQREQMIEQFGDLDSELVNVDAYHADGDAHAAHETMRAALQLAYELIGDCDALDTLDTLADAVGFAWPEDDR